MMREISEAFRSTRYLNSIFLLPPPQHVLVSRPPPASSPAGHSQAVQAGERLRTNIYFARLLTTNLHANEEEEKLRLSVPVCVHVCGG